MSQPNRKYKQLEALLSEARPADPNPASQPAHGDVEELKARVASLEAELDENRRKQDSDAISPERIPTNFEAQSVMPEASAGEKQAEELKTRISELEAQLAGQSGSAEKKAPRIVQQTVSRFLVAKSAKESQSNAAKQLATNKQPSRFPEDLASKVGNAFLIATAIAAIHFVAVLYYLYLGQTTGMAQFYALAAISFALGVLFILGAVLSRRGQPTLGIILVLGTLSVSYPPIATLVSGLGLVLGLALMVVGPLSAFQVLPRRSGWVMTVLTIVAGLATLLLDVFGSTARPLLPGIVIQLLAASVIGVLVFFIIRQRIFISEFLSNISVAWKMALMVSALFLGLLGITISAYVGMQSLRYQLSNIYDFMLIPILAISEADTALADAQYQIENLNEVTGNELAKGLEAVQADDKLADEIMTRYDKEWVTTVSPEFTQALRDAGKIELQQQEIAALKSFHVAFDAYKDAVTKYLATIQAGNPDASLANEAHEKLLAARVELKRLIDVNNEFADFSNAEAQAAYRQALLYGGIVLGISLALGLFISYLIVVSITSRLGNLTRGAAAMQEGNLDQTVAVAGRDEVTLLGNTLNAMAIQLKNLFATMEQRVQDRTHDLELASEVGRTVSEKVSNLYDMLSEATEMIRSRFDLYYTQVYLLDPTGHTITLRAGTGDAGKQLLSRGHHLLVSSDSLNGRAVSEKKPIIVPDTAKNPNFLPNPLLPNTRSEMAVPLIVSGRVLGVLDMQSEIPDALNQANLPAFETLAGQLSIAIQNATLFAQSEEARKQVEANVRRITESGWGDFLNAIERGEKIGYTFNQINVVPMENFNGMKSTNALNVSIMVTGANVGSIQLVEEERNWTAQETEIVQAAAEQLAQHLDNLRLLAQAEGYRSEAEQAVRRLTREGWETFVQTRNELTSGFTYDLNNVHVLESGKNNGHFESAITKQFVVRNETVGELAVNIGDKSPEDINDLINAVAEQLGGHIENLRLLEQAEQGQFELQRGEARLRTLVENAPEAIVILDLTTGLFIEPNENAVKLYGLPREELIKVGPAQMSPPTQPDGRDSTEKAKEKVDEAMQGGTPVFDWIHRNAQGENIPCEIRLVRMPGDLPQVRSSITDITERKKSQDIIARRASELQSVATVSTTASTVLDPDKLLQGVVDLTKERFNLYHTHIYLADDSWNTLLLAAGAGDIGRQMVDTGHAIQIDTERSLVARAARERNSVIVNDVRGEAGFLPNPMLPETRSEMAVPMIVGDKVIGVFDVQSDSVDYFTDEDANIYTTLASQVAVALQNARLYVEQAATVTQLRELDRLKSSFLANMSHELRTPLNSILGFADVMLEELDGPLTENMSNDLGLIYKNGQHLLHLINDVLDMAKIESGKMNLNIEKFNLQETIEEVVSITSPLASEKNLALFIEPDSDHELEIHADKIRLRQVMINIINNSIKFTDIGKVSIRVAREENNALISVKDTGLGIPAELLESVFQEFTQVDTTTTRKEGGTGLGLPISRRLIEMHSGRLWAESSGIEGEGSTFFVSLPIEAKINEEAAKAK